MDKYLFPEKGSSEEGNTLQPQEPEEEEENPNDSLEESVEEDSKNEDSENEDSENEDSENEDSENEDSEEEDSEEEDSEEDDVQEDNEMESGEVQHNDSKLPAKTQEDNGWITKDSNSMIPEREDFHDACGSKIPESEESKMSKLPAKMRDKDEFHEAPAKKFRGSRKSYKVTVTRTVHESTTVPREEIGLALVHGARSPTFIENVQSMGNEQRIELFSRIRFFFITFMNRNPVNQIPNMNIYLSSKVIHGLDLIQSHFRSFYFRVSVDAPITIGGHHPLFTKNCLNRRGVLDPISFRTVPTIGFFSLISGQFLNYLIAEIRDNKNERLRTYLSFHINEQLDYLSIGRKANMFVRQNGLTVHEVCFFYYICSRRILLLDSDDMRYLEQVLPYFHLEDIRRICAIMSKYITDHPEIEENLNDRNYIDQYGGFLYLFMMASVRGLNTSYIHMECFHENLSERLQNRS